MDFLLSVQLHFTINQEQFLINKKAGSLQLGPGRFYLNGADKRT